MTPDTSDPSLIRNSWDDPEFTDGPRSLTRGLGEIHREGVALRAEVERLRATVAAVEALADCDKSRDDHVHRWIDGSCLVDGETLRAVLAGGVAADAPTSSDGDHPVTEYGTTRCPRNGGIAANIDDGECSSCGGEVSR